MTINKQNWEKFSFAIAHKISANLLKVGLFFEWPKFTAIILSFVAGRNIIQSKADAQYCVLCLGRSIFLDDLKVMAKYNGKIKYLILHLSYWEIVYNNFISQVDREKITENNYYDISDGIAGIKRYHNFVDKMFPLMRKLLRFKAVMSCNIGYPTQQEFSRICQERNFPFIILHKEGLTFPEDDENKKNIYRNYRFYGKTLLLYNEKIKKLLLDLKINGVTEEKMKIIGIPRLDRYFREQTKEKNKRLIVFFSFNGEKFTYMIQDQMKRSIAEKRLADYHVMIMDYARQYPDVEVVIKTKVSQHYLDYVNEIYTRHFPEKIDNLIISNSLNSYDLIINSMAIIGFHSTTLIEGLAAGKNIILLDFRDLVPDSAGMHFKDYPELVQYVKNIEELVRGVESESRRIDEIIKNKFLHEFIYIPDGRASQRAEEEIIRSINI